MARCPIWKFHHIFFYGVCSRTCCERGVHLNSSIPFYFYFTTAYNVAPQAVARTNEYQINIHMYSYSVFSSHINAISFLSKQWEGIPARKKFLRASRSRINFHPREPKEYSLSRDKKHASVFRKFPRFAYPLLLQLSRVSKTRATVLGAIRWIFVTTLLQRYNGVS